MPIKFRCDYCRQLMGIAHNKAGSLIDCPSCGRRLRVPNLDGSVAPQPSPKVDHADDGLRRALDELALIGLTDDEPESKPQTSGAVLPEPSELIAKSPLPPPGGRPEASPLAPATARAGGPAAATVVTPPVKPTVQLVNSLALEPLPQQVVMEPPPRSPTAGASPPVQSVSLAGSSPEEILAELANQAAPQRPAAIAAPGPVVIRGYSLSLVLLVAVLSFAAGIAAGWGLGRVYVVQRIADVKADTAVTTPVEAPVAKPLVRGHITYRNAQGQLEPDAGANVLILPVKPENPLKKLPALGLRPNDDHAAHELASKSLSGQGGRLAIVDDEGSFQLELPAAGDYRLLVLSHFQGHPQDADTDTTSKQILEELEKLFERPEQLIGKLAFKMAEIKHKGTVTVIWDHTFSPK